MKYLFLFLPLFCFGQTDTINNHELNDLVNRNNPIFKFHEPITRVVIVEPVIAKIFNNGVEINSTTMNRINVFTVAAEFAKEDNKACLNLMGMIINCATHCEDESFAHFYENTYPQYLKDLFKNPSTAYCAFQIYSKL